MHHIYLFFFKKNVDKPLQLKKNNYKNKHQTRTPTTRCDDRTSNTDNKSTGNTRTKRGGKTVLKVTKTHN